MTALLVIRLWMKPYFVVHSLQLSSSQTHLDLGMTMIEHQAIRLWMKLCFLVHSLLLSSFHSHQDHEMMNLEMMTIELLVKSLGMIPYFLLLSSQRSCFRSHQIHEMCLIFSYDLLQASCSVFPHRKSPARSYSSLGDFLAALCSSFRYSQL